MKAVLDVRRLLVLRAVALHSSNATLVPAALADLAARGLHITVSLVEAGPDQAFALLQNAECDLAITFDHPTLPAPAGLVTVPLLDDHLRDPARQPPFGRGGRGRPGRAAQGRQPQGTWHRQRDPATRGATAPAAATVMPVGQGSSSPTPAKGASRPPPRRSPASRVSLRTRHSLGQVKAYPSRGRRFPGRGRSAGS